MVETIKYNYLINQYKNRIYSYAFYMMRNRMDADDVTQEVFIRIWKNMGVFNLSSARSWIMKTTHNLCLDYLRSRKAAVERSHFVDEENEEIIKDEFTYAPDDSAHYSFIEEDITEAVKRLPEKLRSVFVMYEIQGIKYSDISDILEIPINSVKVYLLRARKKLQMELIKYRPEEVNKYG
jgi:RNA polymerase sigma-70 factor, ECF subfamily